MRRSPSGLRDSNVQRRSRVIGPLVCGVVAFLCYANSLSNGFAYDDYALVQKNARLADFTDLRAIFLTDWWLPQTPADEIEHKQRDRLYRPLALFSLALNYALHELHPFGYHLANVFFHALATGLVFAFALRLSGHAGVAWMTALAFAVHPVHVEAVANVVGRAEVLACLGLLLGCLLLLPPGGGMPGWGRVSLAALTFFAALLSKETAICYPAVALVILWSRAQPAAGRWRAGHWLLALLLLCAPLALYFPLRYIALGGHLLRDRAPSELLNALTLAEGWQRVWMSLDVLGHYVRLMILPQKLSSSYGYAVLDPQRGPGLLTFAGLAAVVALLSGLLAFRARSPLTRCCAIAAALFLASYLLISNTVVLIGVDVAERLMYWPSVPALLLLACAVARCWERQTREGAALAGVAPLLRIAGVALLGALAFRTLVRNPDWAGNGIFAIDARTYPQSATLHVGAARELLRDYQTFDPVLLRERAAEADAFASRAMEIQPHYVDALIVRSKARALLGDMRTARALVDTALALEATDLDARELLRLLQELDAGNQLPQLETALATRPADPALREEYIAALLQAGRFEDARVHAERLRSDQPANATAHRLLGDALIGLSEQKAARIEYERAVSLDPNNWQAHSNLVSLLADVSPEAALAHAQAAHRLRPTEFTTIANLAQMLGLRSRWSEALPLYEQLRAGLPADDPLRPVIEERIREARRKARR